MTVQTEHDIHPALSVAGASVTTDIIRRLLRGLPIEQAISPANPLAHHPPNGRDPITTVERVARLIAGVDSTGKACILLRSAGLPAAATGDRVQVEGVIAELLRGAGEIEPRWVVYRSDGSRPVWLVGAGRRS